MDWFHIRNWRKFQHYKAENPAWIKLHARDLMLSPESPMLSLSDSDFGRLVRIWVAATCYGGKIPDDAATLLRLVGLKSLNSNLFILKGLIVPEESCICLHNPEEPCGKRPSESESESESDNSETDSYSLASQTSAEKKNGEVTEARFRTAWRNLFERFYADFPRKGHRAAAEVKWMAKAPAFNAAAKADPQGALKGRYGEFVDRLNEIIDEQAGNLDTGNNQYIPYADAFLNREF